MHLYIFFGLSNSGLHLGWSLSLLSLGKRQGTYLAGQPDCHATNAERQTSIHTYFQFRISKKKPKKTANLSSDCGRKPEYPKRHRENMRSTRSEAPGPEALR